MANVLSKEKQKMAISALCEGSSIRSIERMTGIHRDTIMRLGIRVGEACAQLHDEAMRFLFGLRHGLCPSSAPSLEFLAELVHNLPR